MPARVEYEATDEDWIALIVWSGKRSPLVQGAARRVRRRTMLGLAAFYVLALPVLWYLWRDSRQAPVLWIFAGIVFGLLLLTTLRDIAPGSLERRLERRVRAGAARGELDVQGGLMRVEVGPDGARVEHRGAVTVFAWNNLKGLEVLEDAVYLDFGGGLLRVPRRAFSSAEDLGSFLTVVEEGRARHAEASAAAG